jgi:16S rRNA (guanine966-N2)-methyltransferase
VTRIIAGQYGGRRIETPKGDGTRPTSDRVREAMFSSIESELGGFDAGLRVLDLFAGSGALGLEALSRGAGHGQFVESDARAAQVIKKNVAALGVNGLVARTTAERFVQSSDTPLPFGLIFLDPPYAMPTGQVASLVATLHERWSEPDALIVVERSSRDPFAWPQGVGPLKDKAYGETHLWYGR